MRQIRRCWPAVAIVAVAIAGGCSRDALPSVDAGAPDLAILVDASVLRDATVFDLTPFNCPPVGGPSVACRADQVCVIPRCCPPCSPLPRDGGICPAGSQPGMCFDGMQACVATCEPPPPTCADVPSGCAKEPACSCLGLGAVEQLCGPYGGICSGYAGTSVVALQCYGCY